MTPPRPGPSRSGDAGRAPRVPTTPMARSIRSAGSFAALRTDMSKDWTADPANFKRQPFPAWSFDVVKTLFEQRGVVAIGHEALDTDITPSMDSETWLLRSGHYQIEVMANLDQVPATGAVIVVTWPKVENGFGFPARAFAILP